MTIDRIEPTRRPAGVSAGTQLWRHLLFMHWPVPVDAMRVLVPAALELDLFEGQAWIGVVPFAMEGVRPWWLPELAAFEFLETNVRTYVHAGGRPGVYFFSLEAASLLAVLTARATFGLPYHHARMRLERDGADGTVVYETRRRGGTRPRHLARYRPGEPLAPTAPGSLEHFFLERYLLFVERTGALWSGQVHHAPYPAHRVAVIEVQDELVAAAGLPAPAGAPALVHYSPGVDVEVFALRRVIR